MELETEEQLIASSVLDEKAPAAAAAAAAAWPADARLYQPLETEQMLLPELASCLAVQTYLRLCRLPFSKQSCANAEFMSPGGRLTRLPLLRVGKQLLSEFEPIVAHVVQVQPEQALCRFLDEEQREQLATMVTHVENTCTLAELHSCFCSMQAYAVHTWPRNGAGHPWPLSMLRRYERKQDAERLLRVYQWHQLDAVAVEQQLHACLQLLDEKLQETQAEHEQEQVFLWGKQPTQLDALLYGHAFTLLSIKLPKVQLAETVLKFPRLVALCQRIIVECHNRNRVRTG